MRTFTARAIVAGGAALALAFVGVAPATAGSADTKVAEAKGYGGAVSTVDLDATKAGIEVLRKGGNAVDAAVAAAAVLGVTEPFSAGIGGGGFFVYYNARTGRVSTIDGRETAPRSATDKLFVDPATGQPLAFSDARGSGLSVGTPGTPLTWKRALDKWGTWSLRRTLQPAIEVADDGFVVDPTFVSQINENKTLFNEFTPTRELYLPGGAPPAAGSVFKNPDMADTYRLIANRGVRTIYGGQLGEEIVETVQNPPVAPETTRNVRPGDLRLRDLANYRAPLREPTRVKYHGLDIYSMGPPSSGGSTVGEMLNILEISDSPDEIALLHHYIEAGALAFADRNRYVGDADFVDVPLRELLSQDFADERACLIDPAKALAKPLAPGVPDGSYAGCGEQAATETGKQNDGQSTTHLTTSDRWGNVVSYTLTIEATGGSGIVVPGRGFLLNNELTDFNFVPTQGTAFDPNLPGPSKRPRSSMSPTIVLKNGKPFVALGSPGGATIIGTVSQTLVNRLDLDMSLLEAVAAPRVSSRNAVTQAEPAFIAAYGEALGVNGKGHVLSSVAEIGAATAIEFGRHGFVTAVAEPTRRGGGSAMVAWPVK
jgi:gamma-glutamyltranspeptidase/glutathione hydrolase